MRTKNHVLNQKQIKKWLNMGLPRRKTVYGVETHLFSGKESSGCSFRGHEMTPLTIDFLEKVQLEKVFPRNKSEAIFQLAY